MTLRQLLEMQSSGALNIKYEPCSNIANLGGVQITLDQARMICSQLGWVEYVISPFEIIDKTNKFIRGLKNHLDREGFLETTLVEFQNKKANTYGKTFDRIVLQSKGFSLSILYNMEHSGGKYVIYETGRALPVSKCRNLKAVAQFINTYE